MKTFKEIIKEYEDKWITNDGFTKAEEKERQFMISLFKKNNIPEDNYSFTPIKSMLRHDGEVKVKGNDVYLFETKVRNVTSTRYNTTIIEHSKVVYLKEQMKLQNKKGLLFFGFKDNKYMVVEIEPNKEYNTINIPCPKTTNGNTELVLKECVEFKIKGLKTLDNLK